MSNTKTNAHIVGNDVDSPAPTAKSKPKSSVSKKTGNKNALCHGVFSNELTLPWESSEDFENLHAKFIEEWKPNGCSEEQAVLELTHCTWIGWRAAKMAQLSFHRAPFGKKFLKSGKKNWQDILQYQQKLPKTTASMLSLINEMLLRFNDVLETVRNRPYSTDISDGKATQLEISRLVSKVGTTIYDFEHGVAPAIRKLMTATTLQWTLFDKAYQPEEIEQQIKVMAAIDARIDKVLRRLTSLKEYKRVAASQAPLSKLIASPSVAPAESTRDIKSI